MRNFCTLSILVFLLTHGYGQESSVSTGGVNTATNATAFNLLLKYLPDINEKASFKALNNASFSGTPEINIQTGGKDAFNGLVAKYAALFMTFRYTTVADIPTPDLSRTFHVFPVSLGFEANKDFSVMNGILEGGWVPWYQNKKDLGPLLRKTKVGVFVQGGYKFDENNLPNGGATDESKEEADKALGRLKASFVFSPEKKFSEGFSIGFIGDATSWFDFLNQELYYRLEAVIRFKMAKDYNLDFRYEKGSGAPNFNQGDQFGAGLTVTF